MPREATLGVALVDNARVVGAIEATWDIRRFHRHRLVRQLRKRPWFVVSPSHPYVARWELVIAITMAFVTVVTPFEVTAMASLPSRFPQPLFVLNIITDSIFAADLVLQFVLGYFDATLDQVV